MSGFLLVQFTPVSPINKTDHHDITQLLLKVELNTPNPNPKQALSVINRMKEKQKSFIYSIRQKLIPFFKLQMNLVISKITGPLQNYELSAIRLKGSRGLSKIGNSVI
jgi:hypothetical protein